MTRDTPPPSAPSWVPATVVGGLLLAVYGPGLNTYDRWIHRAYVSGPTGSTCTLSIGDQTPTQLASDPRYLVDSTPAGAADYGAWTPPLPVPAGYLAVFCWFYPWAPTAVPIVLGAAGARVEVESA